MEEISGNIENDLSKIAVLGNCNINVSNSLQVHLGFSKALVNKMTSLFLEAVYKIMDCYYFKLFPTRFFIRMEDYFLESQTKSMP